MTTKKLFTATAIILATASVFTSCRKDEGCTNPEAINYDIDADKDDGSCEFITDSKITFNFTHNFDGAPVSSSNFNQFDFVNAFGDTLSISKLRYLISKIRLHKSNGDSVLIDGYNLVDVTNATNLSYATTVNVPVGDYTGVSFNFGFDSLDNTGNYLDLNSASWNWPGMLGGGYHFMQMEGKYKHMGNDSTYAYHHGTARVSMGNFEQNFFNANLGGVSLKKANVNMEIKMNIAEWYKNPNTWDLNTMHAPLMPNYNAQIMMKENGPSVFSLGTVTQQ
ncbi:MAG: MbnP family protein [Vicingaceae bacterium]